MEKILDTVEAIAHEKNILPEHALEAFREALINTAKKLTTQESSFEVNFDMAKKDYSIQRCIKIVKNDDERLAMESDSFMALETAQEFDSSIEVGDQLKSDFNLEDYGRTASANLFRELEYHIQRRIEQTIFEKYRDKVGTLMIGIVSRVDAEENTYIDIGELKGVLTLRNRIKGEKFKAGDTVKTLLRFVSIDPKFGLFLELTRTSPKFLETLLAKEVPEIADEVIEIISSARIPGERAKIALRSNQANIDPIGATVGTKGIRINAISNELVGENIDCIEYSTIPEIFIMRALSPAMVQNITIKDKNAVATITADQKAKAIGRSGINIRLASMLTGYTIELKEVEGTSTPRTETNTQIAHKTTDTSALSDLFK